MTPYLVVETSPSPEEYEKWWAMPATPGKDPERTARNFGYSVVGHFCSKEAARQFIWDWMSQPEKEYIGLKATEAAVAELTAKE